MSNDRPSAQRPPKPGTAQPQAYEPPQIAWVEPYEPLGFGVSCLKVEGNPGCTSPGPIFT